MALVSNIGEGWHRHEHGQVEVGGGIRPGQPEVVAGAPVSAGVAAALSVLVVLGVTAGTRIIRAIYGGGWEGLGPFLLLMAALALIQIIAIVFGIVGMTTSRRRGARTGVLMSLAPALSLLWVALFWSVPGIGG